jgi:hypothetical protein
MTKPRELYINRGVELLLRKRREKPDQPKTFKFSFGKMVSLLRREIHVYFEFSFDIKKKGISRR